MKPEEFQLGDLILAPYYGKMVPSRIVSLTMDRLMYEPLNPGPHKPGPYVSNGENIAPIPLSEEGLGVEFPTSEIITWWPCEYPSKVSYFHIEYAKDNTNVAIDINYVHELQHILRDCKIQHSLS